MKVGIYLARNKPETGGVHTFEQTVLASLCQLRETTHHEFVLFLERKRDDKSVCPKEIGKLKVIPFFRQNKLLKLLRILASKIFCWPIAAMLEDPLQKKAKKEGVEFMFFLTHSYWPIEIPYIANMFDIQHRLQPWFPEVNYQQQWPRREAYFSAYLRQAASIIAPNEIAMKELSFFYQIPSERFCLLTHPVPEISSIPSEEQVAQVLQKFGIKPGYLFYPAQFWAHKNHANLLLALNLLREKYAERFELILVGSDKGNAQYIRDLAKKLNLEIQVHILGFVDRCDLVALYKGAFALVYVSLFGPENLPPLEAFVCECPVIASNVPGAQEQLGEAALLVNALSPEEIASAIKNLKHDENLRTGLISKARLRAQKFKGQDFMRGIFKVLDSFEPIRRTWK